MKNTLLVAFLILTLVFGFTAHAANENEWYIGAQYSNQKITSSSDIKLNAAGVILGYQLNKNFAFETRLNVGVSEHSSQCTCEYKDHVYKQELDNQGSLFIKATYPILDNFNLYALAGVTKSSFSLETKSHSITVEGNTTIISVVYNDAEQHSKSGFTYGVGINYQIAKQLAVFLDYQVLPNLTASTLDSSNWKSASVGVSYAF